MKQDIVAMNSFCYRNRISKLYFCPRPLSVFYFKNYIEDLYLFTSKVITPNELIYSSHKLKFLKYLAFYFSSWTSDHSSSHGTFHWSPKALHLSPIHISIHKIIVHSIVLLISRSSDMVPSVIQDNCDGSISWYQSSSIN